MAQDEFSLIRRWTNRVQEHSLPNGLTVGIGDDAAVFSVGDGMEVVACCDAMIETVHFLRETMRFSDIGYKAMISNISDIAAMGGIPRYALVTIGVSPNWSADECEQIYDGIYEAANDYHVSIIGGDTVSTPDALHLSVTLLGEVERGRALLRSAARPGHIVFVTGTLGDSAAGLHLLLAAKERQQQAEKKWQPLIDKHQRPSAQIAAGRLLNGLAGREAMGAVNDISDGLASELWEIAEASHVSIVIDEELIPLSQPMLAYAEEVGQDPLLWALTGGEDYQLVGTVPALEADRLAGLFKEHGLFYKPIGRVMEPDKEPVRLMDSSGRERPLHKSGYNHFRR